MLKDPLFFLIILSEGLLVALAGAGWLSILLRRAHRLVAEKQAQLTLLAKRQASVFLTRELASSGEAMARAANVDIQAERFAKFRRTWLAIEQRALSDEGGLKSDYAVIERLGTSVLDAVATRPNDAAEQRRRAAARALTSSQEKDPSVLLSKAKAVIVVQKEMITQLKEKVAALHARREPTMTENGLHDILDQAQINAASQSSSITKVEEGLDVAKSRYNEASQELVNLQASGRPAVAGGSGASRHEGGLLIVSTDGNRLETDSVRSLLSTMEDTHRDSINELRLMRDTNARQRKLILQLEGQLAELKAGTHEHETSLAVLAALKAQLGEYENCTATLELETANLHARIATLNALIENAEQQGQVDLTGALHSAREEAAALRQQIDQSLFTICQLSKIGSSGSIERAAGAMLTWLETIDINAVICLRGAERSFWLATHARPIDNTVKHLLQSVVPTTDSSWTSVRKGAIFVGYHLRLYLEDDRRPPDQWSELKESLSIPVQIADVLFRFIIGSDLGESAARKNVEAVRHIVASTSTQHHYLMKETARIGDKLYDELGAYFKSATLTKLQKECTDGMLEDFKSELNLLSRASKAIHNNLQLATKKLSEPA